MIASVQPQNQERGTTQNTNPIISKLDRRRLKAAFFIADGESNKIELREKSGLAIDTIKNMLLIYNAYGIFYLGNNKKKFHTMEEIQFIREYFEIEGNRGKVFRHLRAEFTRLYEKKIGLRFASKILKREGIWYRIVRKRMPPEPDRTLERRRAVRSIIKAWTLNYTIVVLDEVHFTKKHA